MTAKQSKSEEELKVKAEGNKWANNKSWVVLTLKTKSLKPVNIDGTWHLERPFWYQNG